MKRPRSRPVGGGHGEHHAEMDRQLHMGDSDHVGLGCGHLRQSGQPAVEPTSQQKVGRSPSPNQAGEDACLNADRHEGQTVGDGDEDQAVEAERKGTEPLDAVAAQQRAVARTERPAAVAERGQAAAPEDSVRNPVIVALNERNHSFWDDELKAAEIRMADEAVLETAVATVSSQVNRLVPAYYQMSFYDALCESETAKRRFITQQTRRAGSAERVDALQKFILDALRGKPGMTHVELLAVLGREQKIHGPIVEVDEASVSFLDGRGRLRAAPITGLKDRLSRARKKLNSR